MQVRKHVEELKRLVKRPKSLSAATRFLSRNGYMGTHLPRSRFHVSHEFRLCWLSLTSFGALHTSQQMFAL